MCRTALLISMLKTSTAFPAMQTARTVMDRIRMTALSVPSATLSSTAGCVLKSVLKGHTMKKTLKTVKVGSYCFPQNSTDIQMGLVKDHPKRACIYHLMSLSMSWKQRRWLMQKNNKVYL